MWIVSADLGKFAYHADIRELADGSYMNDFSRKSLSSQLYDVLARNILSGTWKPGTAIANEIDLARSYGVSVGTMRKALSRLDQDGLIHRRQGRGSFVSDPTSSELRETFENLYHVSGKRLDLNVVQVSCMLGAATADQRHHLRLSEEIDVAVCGQILRDRDKPVIYREAHIPGTLFSESDWLPTWDVFSASRLRGYRVSAGVERMVLTRPDKRVAAALDIDETATLAMFDRVVTSIEGKPLEWLVYWSGLPQMLYVVQVGR